MEWSHKKYHVLVLLTLPRIKRDFLQEGDTHKEMFANEFEHFVSLSTGSTKPQSLQKDGAAGDFT
jgi:hypothetical protein